MDVEDVLIGAIQKWGLKKQSNILIEEMSELTKEVCKQARKSDDFKYTYPMIEEIADVQIMIAQMIEGMDCGERDTYRSVFAKKLIRLEEKIKG